MIEAMDLDREERKAQPTQQQSSSRGSSKPLGQTQCQSKSCQGQSQSQGYLPAGATHTTKAAATVAGHSRNRGRRRIPVASSPGAMARAVAVTRTSPRTLLLTRDPPRRGSSQHYLRPVFTKHLPKDKYLLKTTYLPKTLQTSPQPSPCPQLTPLVHIPLPHPDVPVGGRLFQFVACC